MDDDKARYKLEDSVNTIESLLQDVHRTLTRVALKRAVSGETKRHMQHKLAEAAKRVASLPLYEEEA